MTHKFNLVPSDQMQRVMEFRTPNSAHGNDKGRVAVQVEAGEGRDLGVRFFPKAYKDHEHGEDE
jgi:hypothetical protein